MTDPKADAWQPCPPGEITRLSARLRFRRALTSTVVVAGVAVAASAATALTVWGVYSLTSDSPPAQRQKKSYSNDDGIPAKEIGTKKLMPRNGVIKP